MKRFNVRYTCPKLNLIYTSGISAQSMDDAVSKLQAEGYTNIKILNVYKCFYKDKFLTNYAPNESDAREIARIRFKLKEKNSHLISVVLTNLE